MADEEDKDDERKRMSSNPFLLPSKSEDNNAEKTILPLGAGSRSSGISQNVFCDSSSKAKATGIFSGESTIQTGSFADPVNSSSFPVSAVFGELPRSKSNPFGSSIGELPSHDVPPSVNLFSGVPSSAKIMSSDFGKDNSGNKGNVFGILTSASLSHSSMPGGIYTSTSSSIFSSTVSAPSLFGGPPNIFGGVQDKASGMITVSSAHSVFGGDPSFTSSSSSGPRLFGGLPSAALASGISKSTEFKTITPSDYAPISVSHVFGAKVKDVTEKPSIAVSKAMSVPETTLGDDIFGGQPDSSSVAAPVKHIFGGQTDSRSVEAPVKHREAQPVARSLFASPDATEEIPLTSEDASLFPASKSKKAEEVPEKGPFPSLIFDGSTSDVKSTPRLFGDSVFGGVGKSRTDEPFKLPSSQSSKQKTSTSLFKDVSKKEKERKETKEKVSKKKEPREEVFKVSKKKEPEEVFKVSKKKEPEEEVFKVSKKKESEEEVFKVSKKIEPKGEVFKVSDDVSEAELLQRERLKHLDDILSSDLNDIFGEGGEKTASTSTGISPPQCDRKEITKIIVAQIPELCMDKDVIRSHFEKYGPIKRIYLNLKSNQATVQFEGHKGASRAKRKGHKIHPMLPEVKIFYAAPARRRSEETSEAKLSKKKAIKTLQQSDRKSPPSDINPFTPIDRPSARPSSKDIFSPIQSRLTKPSSSTGPATKISKPIVKENKDLKRNTFSNVLPDYKTSPQPVKKVGASKITRHESPKPAQLKLSETSKTPSRSSPAREYTVFADIKDIKATMNTKTKNSNDRYNVLKARDKLLRSETKKRLDIKKATSLDAGCPDMCPELERYRRDVQNDLSSFEITNGVLDHKLVVKKFSRSSADKEEPLPHELRPGDVLLKTMDFLTCNIMVQYDRPDIDVGIWYNYLWDRTRAIRSDISQQQLTDEVAVTIIERCVRFHIFAAVYLCEESPDVFDRKLNTENLTKSLQTLKELYKDLAEMGKYFSSESEFRAYEILLNLNDGEKIVHQYAQYRDEVQKSPQVTHALKVSSALKTNNFVKFFKLIRNGTYLQGCISHRYFPQARSKALDCFARAYIVSKRVNIPLSFIIKTLGFEDHSDAESYLNYHGIKISGEKAVFDKNLIDLHPEGQPPVRRPVNLMEPNRLVSVAEVIQGGPIPENPIHSYVPHDSFDEEGNLKPNARDASDQFAKMRTLHSSTSNQLAGQENIFQQSTSDSSRYQSKEVTDESHGTLKDTFNDISFSVVVPLVHKVAHEAYEDMTRERARESAIQAAGNNIVSEFVKQESKSISQDAFKAIQHEEKMRKIKEEEDLKEKERDRKRAQLILSKTLCREFTEEAVAVELEQLCKDSIREVEREVRQHVHNELLKEMPPKLCKEVIREEITEISQRVISDMTLEMEMKIEKLQSKIALRKMRNHFVKWRKIVLRVKRGKEAQITFPASFSQLSLREQNESFAWGYKRKHSENMSADRLLALEKESADMSKKLRVMQNLKEAVGWYPLPIQQDMQDIIKGCSRSFNILRCYFKVILCTTPDVDDTVLKWIRSKLIGIENGAIHEKLDCNFHFVSNITGLQYGCHFQEASLGSITNKDKEGASAILFLTNDHTGSSVSRDIRRMVTSNPNLPYKIISEKDSTNEIVWKLRTEDILDIDASQTLKEIVMDMWEKHSQRMQITSSQLNNFVSGFVSSHFIQTSILKQQERSSDLKSPLYPKTYIKLYNAVIEFLMKIIDDQDLLSLDWPAPEFSQLEKTPPPTWNNTDLRTNLKHLAGIRLPILEVEGFVSWKELTNILWSFVDQISHPEEFSYVLWSRIDSLLSNTSRILSSRYNLDFDNTDTLVHVLHLPWTELLYACVSYRLEGLTSSPVFYQPKHLQSFTYPSDWWTACDYSDPTWKDITYESVPVITRKRKATEEEDYPSKKMSSVPSEFLCDFIREQEASAKFTQKLENALLEGDSPVPVESDQRSVGSVNSLGAAEGALGNNKKLNDWSELFTSDLMKGIDEETQRSLAFLRKLEKAVEEGDL